MNQIQRSAAYVHNEHLPMEQRSRETPLRTMNEYCDIDPPGAAQRIWKLLETPQTVETICRVLTREYPISNETCSVNVQSFLGELLHADLIQISPDT
jgi:hypothetical protein